MGETSGKKLERLKKHLPHPAHPGLGGAASRTIAAASKQGHSFIHSSGSISPLPFRSGLSRGDRRGGCRDNRAATALRAPAGSVSENWCGYRQDAPARPARPRNKYRHCERYGLWHAPRNVPKTGASLYHRSCGYNSDNLRRRIPAQVVCGQLMFGIATVATGSGTMNDDEVDKSHFY